MARTTQPDGTIIFEPKKGIFNGSNKPLSAPVHLSDQLVNSVTIYPNNELRIRVGNAKVAKHSINNYEHEITEQLGNASIPINNFGQLLDSKVKVHKFYKDSIAVAVEFVIPAKYAPQAAKIFKLNDEIKAAIEANGKRIGAAGATVEEPAKPATDDANGNKASGRIKRSTETTFGTGR